MWSATRRAGLVARAEDWRWSSLWRRRHGDVLPAELLSRWPVALPPDWARRVNRASAAEELDALRRSVQRGQPYGSEQWVRAHGKAARPGIQPSRSRPSAQRTVGPFRVIIDSRPLLEEEKRRACRATGRSVPGPCPPPRPAGRARSAARTAGAAARRGKCDA